MNSYQKKNGKIWIQANKGFSSRMNAFDLFVRVIRTMTSGKASNKNNKWQMSVIHVIHALMSIERFIIKRLQFSIPYGNAGGQLLVKKSHAFDSTRKRHESCGQNQTSFLLRKTVANRIEKSKFWRS